MALVRDINPIDGRIGRQHDEVECSYYVFPSGRPQYLAIETYPIGRDKAEGPSQILQFDVSGAKRMKELIEQTFPFLK
jgi:hypothetical protein